MLKEEKGREQVDPAERTKLEQDREKYRKAWQTRKRIVMKDVIPQFEDNGLKVDMDELEQVFVLFWSSFLFHLHPKRTKPRASILPNPMWTTSTRKMEEFPTAKLQLLLAKQCCLQRNKRRIK